MIARVLSELLCAPLFIHDDISDLYKFRYFGEISQMERSVHVHMVGVPGEEEDWFSSMTLQHADVINDQGYEGEFAEPIPPVARLLSQLDCNWIGQFFGHTSLFKVVFNPRSPAD